MPARKNKSNLLQMANYGGRLAFIAWVIVMCPVFVTAQEDSASALAQILANKGVITTQEAQQVTAADQSARLKVLAGLLQQKGVLNSTDLAKLSLPQAPAPALAGPSSAAIGPAPAPTTVLASSGAAVSAPQASVPKSPAEANTGSGTPVTFYGTLLFNAGFNTVGSNISDTATIANKSGSSTTSNDQSFWATARQTRFGLRLNPTRLGGAQATGALEIDAFSSGAPFPNGFNMGLFRLRTAYARLDWSNVAVEAGQDWTIFAPLNPSSLAMFAVPEFNGSGNAWARAPQIRVEAKAELNARNRLLFQASVNDSNLGDYPSAFSGAATPGVGELGRMPAIESRIAWTTKAADRDFTLGFSGHYGRGKDVGTVNNATVTQPVDSWGAAVDYTLPFARVFNLSGEAYIGRALGLYNAAAGEAVGAVNTPAGHGVLARGGWLQLQFNLTKQWQANTGYGIDDEGAHDVAVGARDRNQNYFANFIYTMNRNIKLSLEYRRLLTEFRNQTSLTGRGNQVTLSAAYGF
jgi:hypothetical protein